MQARIDIVKMIKKAFTESGEKIPHFKDVETPRVNYQKTFATIKLVDTPLVLAITTVDNVVSITNITTRKIDQIKVSDRLRNDIINQLLQFTNCVRY